ncbi:aromatic aminobenezylarsenical efflux permease ArsG family transporter [Arcticibacter tournemirensis]|uniref:Sulfite exporter TauE/SafE family protein n=1 Tax=Arcticibacter tournemirensis TaxID=699437 RepID=A0A4Q0MGM2_9SPHI|nr:aromatic aminobenezylarsenical efflux permease ArsG family transporter [Arcticibacter tournemirensis]RXF72403.1 sulfite exporter TauE/SafE family protein [Arcticibacter tournemirensis]
MDFLNQLLDQTTMPALTAIVLGLMTALSPCPLATNITAVAFISGNIENRNRVFINGLFYTVGRAVAYTALALVIYLGADEFELSGFFQRYGEKVIGPLLLIIGFVMLGILKINFPGMHRMTSRLSSKTSWRYPDAFLLGLVFAMAFCPYSGVLYFGMLIPMTISSTNGLYLPLLFALATGIPVIVFSGLLAYAVSGIGGAYSKIKTFELWFRRFIALIFILVGLYYIINIYLLAR